LSNQNPSVTMNNSRCNKQGRTIFHCRANQAAAVSEAINWRRTYGKMPPLR
jgi:hypothetical protein